MDETARGGFIMYHPDLMTHDNVSASREGGRISLIINQLIMDGLWGDQVYEADMAPLKRLRDVHDEEYLNELHKRVTVGVTQLDEHTPVMEKSFELARIGVGEALDAIDMIMSGEASSAFCLTPMPGNQAGVKNFSRGCLVNTAAAAAHYLTKKFQLKKVLILNLDALHGKGTQEIFWKRKDVLVMSLHEYPGITGTGHYSEVGENPAKGYTVNIPFPSGYGDREYLAGFKEIVKPIINQYQPEFFILSWSPSPMQEDAGSRLIMSEYGLQEVLRETMALAKSYSQGRILSILESGTPGKAMARAVSQHVMLLLNNRLVPVDKGKKVELISYSDWYSYAKVLKAELRKYWRI